MISLKQLLGSELQAEDGVAGRVSDYLIDQRTWTVSCAEVPVGGVFSDESRYIGLDHFSLGNYENTLTTSRTLSELAAIAAKDTMTKGEEGWGGVHIRTSQPKPATITRDLQSPWCSFNAMLGNSISATDGVYGSLDDLLVEVDQWSIQYFVGRSYGWKKKSSVLIPASWVEQVSWMGETVRFPPREKLSKENLAINRHPTDRRNDMDFDWQHAIFETIIPLISAASAGALIGWDREALGKVAGLRTHMLVCLGAATFVVAAAQLAQRNAGTVGIQIDTARIIEGVATGIGFLGAGSIVKFKQKVEGVTTAASIWVTGAIGATCGAGLYLLAAVAAVLALLILRPGEKLKDEVFDGPPTSG